MMRPITGTTRVAAVIGNPVRHSLSPALHNAAFAQLGLDWVYTAFDVAPGAAADALAAMKVLGLGGLSVTMPHKEAVAAAVDTLDPAAAALRSVNTVVPQPGGSLMGHSTDGAGFVASLAAAGVAVAGRSVCLLGAGAAARSIADALARAGVARVAVINRTFATAQETVRLAGVAGVIGSAADVRDADIVVNATSIGMGSNDLPCDAALLRAGQVVADVVYHPRTTALLVAAAAAGATCIDGLGMLVHQAALQQQLWHGELPDIAAMTAAAERELAARRQ
ncbi:MAG: shikimate dehydrogenase [Actinomycetota bacterium]|nr:shikimate dehydrogenase [Actinomycetota bacterium]